MAHVFLELVELTEIRLPLHTATYYENAPSNYNIFRALFSHIS